MPIPNHPPPPPKTNLTATCVAAACVGRYLDVIIATSGQATAHFHRIAREKQHNLERFHLHHTTTHQMKKRTTATVLGLRAGRPGAAGWAFGHQVRLVLTADVVRAGPVPQRRVLRESQANMEQNRDRRAETHVR